MKAVRYHRYGGSDVLRYEEAPRPVPGPGQVLVKVAATSFNPVDAGIRGGYLSDVYEISFPHIPGVDVAGTIAELGDGVQGWKVGDAVVAFLPLDADGAAAEFTLVPAESLAAAPRSVDLTDAAALPEAALTAWQALFDVAGRDRGGTVRRGAQPRQHNRRADRSVDRRDRRRRLPRGHHGFRAAEPRPRSPLAASIRPQ